MAQHQGWHSEVAMAQQGGTAQWWHSKVAQQGWHIRVARWHSIQVAMAQQGGTMALINVAMAQIGGTSRHSRMEVTDATPEPGSMLLS